MSATPRSTAPMPAPVEPILDLLNGFRKSKVLFTAVRLGLFDAIHTRGPCSPSDVAALITPPTTLRNIPVSIDGVSRLMQACSSLGLLSLTHHGSPPSPKFALTSLAESYLLPSSPLNLTGYIIHSDQVLFPLWTHLDSSVLSGSAAWADAFPNAGSTDDVFGLLYPTEPDRLRFMMGMHGLACVAAGSILTTIQKAGIDTVVFGENARIVDLGGATGAMVRAFCERYRSLNVTATVADLPAVISDARKNFGLDSVDAEKGIAIVKGLECDFVRDREKIPRCEVVVLSRILHDWGDDTCVKILEGAFGCLESGGHVLICEMVVDEHRCGPVDAMLQDLNMLVQTKGRERTAGEYKSLLERVGFTHVKALKTGGYLDVVVACKW
ncbi:O-methyltransferase-domain-containing protein [Cladochytrium replicatum]|nr:O-methyltransferase-domain-containing protein [Cladochytrium replicatum]